VIKVVGLNYLTFRPSFADKLSIRIR